MAPPGTLASSAATAHHAPIYRLRHTAGISWSRFSAASGWSGNLWFPPVPAAPDARNGQIVRLPAATIRCPSFVALIGNDVRAIAHAVLCCARPMVGSGTISQEICVSTSPRSYAVRRWYPCAAAPRMAGRIHPAHHRQCQHRPSSAHHRGGP